MEIIYRIPPIILVFVLLFFLFSPVFPIPIRQDNQTIPTDSELKVIKDHLKKINKPFVKSIQSPDGDTIDCVLFHLQHAFDHPELKETMPLDPLLEPSNDNNKLEFESELKQTWSSKEESCPDGTIPIRRTSEDDLLRSLRIPKFGKKFNTSMKTDLERGHEHATGIVRGEYYGAQGKLNVWDPIVTNQNELSLSQIWIITDISNHDLNAIEAGWQVNPAFTGDNSPRFFIFWTTDGYRTGCYNLLCSGFVQTSSTFALGATFDPISIYNGQQLDIKILIWKDPKSGNWWLKVGPSVVGYWPKTIFSDLKNHATMVMFGGEVYNSQKSGSHTSTQMGSGHFPDEGLGKAAYISNMEVIDAKNTQSPVANVNLYAEKPNCYNVKSGFDTGAGNYIFFGGPGKNSNCP